MWSVQRLCRSHRNRFPHRCPSQTPLQIRLRNNARDQGTRYVGNNGGWGRRTALTIYGVLLLTPLQSVPPQKWLKAETEKNALHRHEKAVADARYLLEIPEAGVPFSKVYPRSA